MQWRTVLGLASEGDPQGHLARGELGGQQQEAKPLNASCSEGPTSSQQSAAPAPARG